MLFEEGSRVEFTPAVLHASFTFFKCCIILMTIALPLLGQIPTPEPTPSPTPEPTPSPTPSPTAQPTPVCNVLDLSTVRMALGCVHNAIISPSAIYFYAIADKYN